MDLDEEFVDHEAEFIESVAAKYAAEDAAATDREDGVDDEDGDADAADSDDTDEHTDPDTSSDDSDGSDDESGDDSAEDDTDDHTEDDESEESTDGDDDEDEDADDEQGEKEATEEEEEPLSDDFKELADRLKIPLTLDDIEDATARQLVEQKFRSMDSAFTRAMQDFRAYRKEKVQLQAEQRFREENPDLAIIEALQKDPTLYERINARLEKLGDEDQVAAFKIVLENKRKGAVEAIESAHAEHEARMGRAAHVEGLAKRIAAKAGLPWEFAESAVERALLRLPEGKRDLSDEDVSRIVGEEAKNYSRHVRAHRREASKQTIRDRTANRRSTPGTKAPATASSPKPSGGGKKKPIDFNNEEERHAAMMATARRLFKGAKDEG